MAVEAALNALHGRDVCRIGACFLASTSRTLRSRSRAPPCWPPSPDLAPRSSPPTSAARFAAAPPALRLALDAVKAGTADRGAGGRGRHPARWPRARRRRSSSATARARLLVGGADVIASFEGGPSVSREFTDVWRGSGRPLPHRAARHDLREGARARQAHRGGGRGRSSRPPAASARTSPRIVLYGPDARTHAALVKQLGLPESRHAEGAGDRPRRQYRLGLVPAGAGRRARGVPSRRPGPRRLLRQRRGGPAVPVHGPRSRARHATARCRPSSPRASRSRTTAGSLPSGATWRPRSCAPSRACPPWCARSGRTCVSTARSAPTAAPSRIPRRHLCWQCSSKNLAEYRISRRGKIFTFTQGPLIPNPDPPTVMVSADLEGGGRFYGQLTDCDPAAVDLRAARRALLPPHPRGRGDHQLLLEVSAG